MSRFITINMNVENARMTYIVKRREYMNFRIHLYNPKGSKEKISIIGIQSFEFPTKSLG